MDTIEKDSFCYAKNFYDQMRYSGPFMFSVDATTIIPALRIRSNQIIGYATNEKVVASTAEEIINIVVNGPKYLKAKQANLFLLSPFEENIPCCIIAISPVLKGETSKTVQNWFETARKYGRCYELDLIGVGADGDGKVRKYYKEEFTDQSKRDKSIKIEGLVYVSTLSEEGGKLLPSAPYPDWKHIIKKWRNQLLNAIRLLVIGSHAIKLEYLMEIIYK